jgi:GPN-loop GTPase
MESASTTSSSSNTKVSTSGGGGDGGPVVLLVIGMAGSGKTTLMGRLQRYIQEQGSSGYLINLDPAVMSIPYEPHVDIRDTVRFVFFSRADPGLLLLLLLYHLIIQRTNIYAGEL